MKLSSGLGARNLLSLVEQNTLVNCRLSLDIVALYRVKTSKCQFFYASSEREKKKKKRVVLPAQQVVNIAARGVPVNEEMRMWMETKHKGYDAWMDGRRSARTSPA